MMLEFLKDVTDKNKAFGALLTDLPKAFACLCHDLLITNLYVYVLDVSSLNLLQDHGLNCKQETKADSFLSSRKDMPSGALQGSIPDPLLFSILIAIQLCKVY